jgi:hypothetical protein
MSFFDQPVCLTATLPDASVALMALSFSLLHVFQSILAFDAYRQFKTRRGKVQIAVSSARAFFISSFA